MRRAGVPRSMGWSLPVGICGGLVLAKLASYGACVRGMFADRYLVSLVLFGVAVYGVLAAAFYGVMALTAEREVEEVGLTLLEGGVDEARRAA